MENFLVDVDRRDPQNLIVKLTDFGCCVFYQPNGNFIINEKVGTLITMAPELIKG